MKRQRVSHERIRRLTGYVLAIGLAMIVIAPGAVAHVGTEFGHLWNQHIKPLLATTGTINATENPVDWTKLKGVPAGLADGLDNGVDRAGFGLKKNVLLGGGTEFAVDATAVQRRLTASCGAGSAIQGVDQSGQVTCNRGPAGFATAINDTGGIANDWATEGTLWLPAGTWAVTAKIALWHGNEDDPGVYADCRLDSPAQTFVDAGTVYSEGYYPEVVPLQGFVTLASEGDIAIVCQDHGSWTHGGWLRIQAIRLGA